MNNLVRHWRLARTYVRTRRASAKPEAMSDFESLRGFFMFVGFRRSGHSLVGSLVDAHPEMLSAHGLDVLRYLRYGFSRRQLLYLIRENSQEKAQAGRVVTGYSYDVPNQWQGRYRSLQVVGCTRGGVSSRRLYEDPSLVSKLEERVGLPVKVVHVVRNPFDNISTIARRGRRRTDLESAIDDYFHMAEGAARLRQHDPNRPLIEVHHEALVADPKRELSRLCEFLGVEAPEDYLRDCASIIFDSPRRTRQQIEWTPVQREQIQKKAAQYPFLAEYSFDD